MEKQLSCSPDVEAQRGEEKRSVRVQPFPFTERPEVLPRQEADAERQAEGEHKPEQDREPPG
jgi:hypothetical protein